MPEPEFDFINPIYLPKEDDKRLVADGIPCCVDVCGREFLPRNIHELLWTCPACGVGHRLHVEDSVPADVPCPYCGKTYCVVMSLSAKCDLYRSRADYDAYWEEAMKDVPF